MIFDTLFAERLTPGPTSDFWYRDTPGSVAAGVNVTPEAALGFSAFYRAIQVVSGSESTLPVNVFEGTDPDSRRQLIDHPIARVLNDQANSEMDSQSFRETRTARMVGWGNGYAEIVRSYDGDVVALEPLENERTRCYRDRRSGRIQFEVRRDDGGAPDILQQRDVFHLKNIGPDGIQGWSVIRLAAQSLGVSLAAERHIGGLYADGMRPAGMLKHPGVPKPDAVERMRTEWEQRFRERRLGVLYGGIDWAKIGVDPNDAQLLQTRKFGVTEIARFTGVPPHLLYDLERSTNNNIEQQSLEFLQHSLRYWIVKWEKTIKRWLLNRPQDRDIYVEYDTSALLRTDVVARFSSFRTAREGGWMSANDVLRAENKPDIGEQGDIYLVPANFTNAKSVLSAGTAPPAGAPVTTPAGAPPDRKPGLSERVIQAHRKLIADALGRMLRKEAAAARTAAKKNPTATEWMSWVDKFYPHHRELIAEAIEPALAAWFAVSETDKDAAACAASISSDLVANTREELAAINGDGFLVGVESVMSRAETGIEIICENIINDA